MNRLIFSTVLAFFTQISFGQIIHDDFIVQIGLHQANSSRIFPFVMSDEGTYPESQQAALFPDFAIFRGIPCGWTKKLLTTHLIFGGGLNQKGFIQNGIEASAATVIYPYSRQLTRSYISFYLGLSRDLIAKKKIRLSLGALFNPEIDVDKVLYNETEYRTVSWGSRFFIGFDYFLAKRFALRIQPYYQMAITNYLSRDVGYVYRPYAYGISMGFAFAPNY